LQYARRPQIPRFKGHIFYVQSGAHLFVSASSGRREGERKTERGEKRAKLEYDSINPAIERVEWQARRAGTTERAFQSMNRKKEEMTKRWRRVGGGMMERHHQPMTMTMRFREVGRLITRWRSTSLCRDRQGHSPIGKDEGEDGRGWERGGKF